MKYAFSALALMSSGLLLSGCGSSSSGSGTAISIPFKAVAGDQIIECGETLTGLGLGNTDAKIADFRLFIHDVKLITDQNIEIPVTLDSRQRSQNSDVVLLDFRDKVEVVGDTSEVCAENTTDNSVANPNFNDTVAGAAAIDSAYTISHIQFTLGVPFNLNHQDQSGAVEPLRNPGLATGMHWNWQNGYKFTAFDVRPVGGVSRPSDNTWSSAKWNTHIGSTGCTVGTSDLGNGVEPEVCPAPNRPVVKLALGDTNWNEAAIEIDYSELVAMSNIAQDNGAAPGCMSGATDPECEDIFDKLGLPWGNNAAQEQEVFSIVER